MATSWNSEQGTCEYISSTLNEDGTYTYVAKITGMTPTWQYVTEHALQAEMLITVTVPSDVGIPGARNVFRFGEHYDITVYGQDFS